MKFDSGRWQLAQYAELKWWRRYLKNQNPTEYLRWKKNYWAGFFENTGFEVSPVEKILEVGCGPAGAFIFFDQNDVVALDPLLENYQKFLPHFQAEKYPKTRFLSQPFENTDFQEYFDLILCLNVINHVGNLDFFVKKLYSTLRPGGRMLLSTDVHNFLIFKKLFQIIPGDILHPQQFSLNDYLDVLRVAGFKIEKTTFLKHSFFFDYWAVEARK